MTQNKKAPIFRSRLWGLGVVSTLDPESQRQPGLLPANLILLILIEQRFASATTGN